MVEWLFFLYTCRALTVLIVQVGQKYDRDIELLYKIIEELLIFYF